MRDSLFRAKRLDDGAWIEGFYYKMNETTYAFADDYEKNPVPTHHYIIFERMTDWGLPNQMYRVEVDPETVCQHIGLTDGRGRRYENDIFQADNGDCIQIYIIVWDEYSLQWSAECIGDPDGTLPLCEFRTDEIDVIGNIFDNPELLGNSAGKEE